MHAAVESSSVSIVATVVQLSGTGMVIQSSHPLRPGSVYQVHLLGVVNVPPFPVRVLREQKTGPGRSRMRRFAAIIEGVDQAWMESVVSSLLP